MPAILDIRAAAAAAPGVSRHRRQATRVPALAGAAARAREKLPLRVQMAILVGALCVLLVGAVSLAATWVGRVEATADANARMAQLAGELGHRFDTGMAQRFNEVGALARLAPLQTAWAGAASPLRSVLEQLQASYPSYAWIGFAGTDGIVHAATGGLLEGQSVRQRPWFSAGLQGPTVSDLHEAVLLNALLPPRLGRAGAEPNRFLDVAFPVQDANGAVIGVLGAHLYSQWIDDISASFTALLTQTQARGTGHAELRVLSADGRVIAGPDAGSQALDGAAVLAIEQAGVLSRTVRDAGGASLEALAVTRGSRGFPGFGWIISARLPARYALAGVRSMALTILGIGLLAAILGVVLSYALAASLASPIQHLCQQAERIGRTQDGAMLNRIGGSCELVALSHSLRSLVRRLGMAERQLVDVVERSSTASAQMQRQMENLRRLADCDPMTGLLNRRGFLDAVKRAPDLPADTDHPGVLIIDIDHFKAVNDSFGHAAGDTVIRAVAEVIKASARHSEIVARFGGEEFVVLAFGMDATALLVLAERVRGAVQQARVIAGQPIAVTVSIGVALYDPAHADVQDAIDRADIALYAAKEGGRNRVCLASAPAMTA